jgi:hypothetical protein
MIVARHVPHVDAHLTGVDLASVTTPLALHAHGVGAPFRETAGIEGDHAIGFPQPTDYFPDQHLEQRTMIPGRCPDELLHDQELDIDQGGNRLGILAVQVGQETGQIEGHMAFAGLGLERVLIGHDEIAQTDVAILFRTHGDKGQHAT